MTFLDRVDPGWLNALATVIGDIERIEAKLQGENFLPSSSEVFRAFEYPLEDVRVVIFGQDPYPTPGHAMGLAFSVSHEVAKLPKSLQNIFIELASDVGCSIPTDGDLTRWAQQGVALINRTLTVPVGVSNGHKNIGWEKVTNEAARILSERDVVAILWGKNAQELAHYFGDDWRLLSAHPSPLSAHRGFFGSQHFSKANELLRKHALKEIIWC